MLHYTLTLNPFQGSEFRSSYLLLIAAVWFQDDQMKKADPHHFRSNSCQIVQKDNFQVKPDFRMPGMTPKASTEEEEEEDNAQPLQAFLHTKI
jgi:hypothetical protein